MPGTFTNTTKAKDSYKRGSVAHACVCVHVYVCICVCARACVCASACACTYSAVMDMQHMLASDVTSLVELAALVACILSVVELTTEPEPNRRNRANVQINY